MELVDYVVKGSVALITLNRPPVNALNSALIGDIDEAVSMAEDDAIRAVVITGNRHFAAGADIARFIDAFEGKTAGQPVASGLTAAIRRLETLAKPTIAAIPGYALGGGLELAMGADFRYLADDAKVVQPEILLGVIPGAGGTQRLPRLIGYQAAKELNMSGRHVAADEALRLGIADKVVEAGDLVTAAMADAARWAEGPTLGYWAVKKAMDEGWGQPLDIGMAAERAAFDAVFATEDAETGIRAFLAKEKAAFIGK
ncbi:MAG: enoyl-CoA hydratase/isomerase family protein [Acidimicrobiia bacterium]